ncbi:MAG TPA: response regulator transcription factor [Chloroflexia bacterium]|jgi:DNA-binding response OmpR family regulator|nr:response regulator transcription factor [Chloroflexia bacterium]
MRILLVEDDRRLSQALQRGLTEEGYHVDAVYDGPTALAAGSTNTYDALLLDLRLPGQDGLAVCRELRRRKIRVPIIVVTALGAVDERIAGLDAGADDYLVKPFAFGELLARLRAVLRRDSETRSSALAAGPIRLDLQTHQVWYETALVDLTATELRLLEYLLTHPGMVLSRSQLEERVWKDELEINSNVVDVYIRRLRRKLDPAGAIIQTVRGMGYRLVRAPGAGGGPPP